MKKPKIPKSKIYYYRIGIWVTITLGIVLGSIIFVVQYNISQLISIKDQFETSRYNQLESQSAVENLLTAQKRSEELDEAIVVLNRGFVPKNNPLSSISELESLAAEYNLDANFNVASGAVDVEDDEVVGVNMGIEVFGDYYNALEFIQALEQLELIVFIDSVTISRSSTPGFVRAQLNTRLYWK